MHVHSCNGSTLESSEHGTTTHSSYQGCAELELSQGLPKVEYMAKLHDQELKICKQQTVFDHLCLKHIMNVAGTLYIYRDCPCHSASTQYICKVGFLNFHYVLHFTFEDTKVKHG